MQKRCSDIIYRRLEPFIFFRLISCYQRDISRAAYKACCPEYRATSRLLNTELYEKKASKYTGKSLSGRY
ncbi:MAG: hypothetical protein BGO31_01825 [Bacteroidetes bacterium 43-16]|nr:MAG: hypothetical protein BGO31_01825 [Bacteroidetes bacterium 43-16]